jgi:hypothetical protein
MRVSKASIRRGVFLGVLGAALLLATQSVSASTFPDVPSTHPYGVAIEELASQGIVSGSTDGKFWPEALVTRQQFAKMIVLACAYPVGEADVCTFTDVPSSGPDALYPDNYVAVCADRGISTGKTPSTYDPGGMITRLQVVSMVVRAARDLQADLLAPPGPTWEPTDTWGSDATHGDNAALAECNGLLEGLDLLALDPHGNMNRGEVAQILWNLVQKLGMPEIAIYVETAADGSGVSIHPTPLPAGQNLTMYAIERDRHGRFIGNVAAVWTMEARGGVAQRDFVPTADGRSAVFKAHLVGTAQITAAVPAVPAGSGVITVIPAAGGLIQFGNDASLGWSGDPAVYFFAGRAGDTVLARINFQKAPWIDTKNPRLAIYPVDDAGGYGGDGRPLAEKRGLEWGYVTEIRSCTLPHTGVYCVVGEADKAELYVQRVNNPVGARIIHYGEELRGSIDGFAVDLYTFHGVKGDTILIKPSKRDSLTVRVQFRLYSPDGHVLSEGPELTDYGLTSTGTYTILAFRPDSFDFDPPVHYPGMDFWGYSIYLGRP